MQNHGGEKSFNGEFVEQYVKRSGGKRWAPAKCSPRARSSSWSHGPACCTDGTRPVHFKIEKMTE